MSIPCIQMSPQPSPPALCNPPGQCTLCHQSLACVPEFENPSADAFDSPNDPDYLDAQAAYNAAQATYTATKYHGRGCPEPDEDKWTTRQFIQMGKYLGEPGAMTYSPYYQRCDAGSGKPWDQNDSTRCAPCADGKVSPASRAGPCIEACGIRAYLNQEQTACSYCPAGKTGSEWQTGAEGTTVVTDRLDVSLCESCLPDHYSSGPICLRCPTNSMGGPLNLLGFGVGSTE